MTIVYEVFNLHWTKCEVQDRVVYVLLTRLRLPLVDSKKDYLL